jgi:hypothetical protein
MQPLWKFWYDYFYAYRDIWWAVAFFILGLSALWLRPYLPAMINDESKFPVGRQYIPSTFQSPLFPKDSILEIGFPEFTVPGRSVRITYLVSSDQKTDEDIEVHVTVGSNRGPIRAAFPSSSFIYRGKVAQGYLEYTFDLPFDIAADRLDLWTEVSFVKEKGTPYVLRLPQMEMPIVRWPSYIVQLVAFLTTVGLVSIKNIGPGILQLWRHGKKPSKEESSS